MSMLENRFGTVAMNADFITKEQLQKALAIQVDENAEGKHRLIGDILNDLGYLTEEQVDKVLLSMANQA